MNGKLLKCALLAAAALLAGCGNAFSAKPQPVRLDVTGQPEGAKVFVDGTLCGTLHGTTPCVVTPLDPGRHLLHVEAPFHRPFDECVRLDGSAHLVSKAVDLKVERGLLLVTTKPAGATVTCQGNSLGTTPLLVTTLPCGTAYVLELSHNGYKTKRVEVKMPDRKPIVREEELVLDSGLLSCTTEPAGATVLVNGIEQGKTPVEVMIPRGGAELTFRLEGYKDVKQSVDVPAGARRTLALQMDGSPARLTVVTEPDDAKVYLDGKFQGKKSPVTAESIAAGEHEVRVERPGFATVSRKVRLDNGGDKTETFKLESVLGRIEVVTTPPGVKISIDGRPVGTTRPQGDSAVSQILLVENVVAGEHAVLAQLDGYFDQSLKVVLGAKETKQLPFTLRRNFTPDTEIETSHGSVRGALVKEKTNEEQIVLEIKPGIEQAIRRDTIRKITNLKE